jgi:hypothetical protein
MSARPGEHAPAARAAGRATSRPPGAASASRQPPRSAWPPSLCGGRPAAEHPGHRTASRRVLTPVAGPQFRSML